MGDRNQNNQKIQKHRDHTQHTSQAEGGNLLKGGQNRPHTKMSWWHYTPGQAGAGHTLRQRRNYTKGGVLKRGSQGKGTLARHS